ncbi:hypothetical protein DOC35_19535 [Salmonella enterica subsp. enterica]|nr:hypothetical protein [Salmonella enterica subsp. enterica]
MKTLYVLSKGMIKADYIPDLEQVTTLRRVIKETPQGLRLCAVDAPEDFKGFLYMRQHYHFFDTFAELMEAIAAQANAAAAELEARKQEATRLMCDAHDALRAGALR